MLLGYLFHPNHQIQIQDVVKVFKWASLARGGGCQIPVHTIKWSYVVVLVVRGFCGLFVKRETATSMWAICLYSFYSTECIVLNCIHIYTILSLPFNF